MYATAKTFLKSQTIITTEQLSIIRIIKGCIYVLVGLTILRGIRMSDVSTFVTKFKFGLDLCWNLTISRKRDAWGLGFELD